jgi:hypothetical protein
MLGMTSTEIDNTFYKADSDESSRYTVIGDQDDPSGENNIIIPKN